MTAKAGNIETDLKLRKFNIIQHVSTTESVQFIETLEEVLRLQRIADYEAKIKTPIKRGLRTGYNRGKCFSGAWGRD